MQAHTTFGETSMKKFLATIAFALAVGGFSSNALAQEEDDHWTVTYQVTGRSEGWLADIGVTRAQNEPALETMVLACLPGDEMTICLDIWNSVSWNDDSGVRDAVGETDFEIEAIWHRLIRGATLRLKGAVYAIEGEDIYSLRIAIDRALGDSCSGTASVETMTGAFEFQVYKLSGACSRALGNDWNLAGSAGVAYNTMGNETVFPLEGSLMRGERISAGFGLGAYFDEDGSDFRGWLRLVLRR